MRDVRNVDGFVPKYLTYFPEQHGNYLLSHTLACLMQPEMRQQLAKRDGMVAAKFMTESGTSIRELPKDVQDAIRKDGREDHIRAKFAYRLYPFYMNKGLTAICDGTVGHFDPNHGHAEFLGGATGSIWKRGGQWSGW